MRTSAIFSTACGIAVFTLPAFADPMSFASPQDAVAAVITSLDARDRDGLLKVFGPENEDVAFTGDADQDKEIWSGFLRDYRQQNRIEMAADDRAVLVIGRMQWPFPAPIVKDDAGWHFDGAAAREEVLLRRIGLNELDVIDLMKQEARVQATFRQEDHDGDGVLEFASAVISDPGQRNGLYWPDEEGQPESPIGEFMAKASADGFDLDGADQEPEPYLGYYFRILQKQGPTAPGGAYDYMVGGNMVAGHALLAYPASPGESGIMSFMMGENGIVYQKDLGDKTLEAGATIDSFDPGDGWEPAE
ncbi:MAG: DUF2950 domain-containing protein [Cereibacter sphaeroides]|uniref:DUF2950 domain-containing protein n=1 Tax=Cereibacter sphaeroides TaxID=1063 RepID=A0A2W5U8P1_CERSP|nr:MAG: DUF2950 domain-containing protein [Cereibacter sphaeroides]